MNLYHHTLHSLSFLSALISTSKDIYDVLSSLMIYALIDNHKNSFCREEALKCINTTYGFSLPSVIVNKTLKHLCNSGLCEKKYKSFIINIEYTKNIYEKLCINNISSCSDYDFLVKKFVDFAKEFGKTFTEDYVHEYLFKFIVDDNTNDEDIYLIYQLFLIKEENTQSVVEIIDNIKKAGIVYSGLCSVPDLNLLGMWNKKISFFLSTDLLFSLFGINGELNKEYVEYFLSLIDEINKNDKKISLYYFDTTLNEIDNYFNAAENLVCAKKNIDPTKPGMLELLSNCLTRDDVIKKEMRLKKLLSDCGIVLFDSATIDKNNYYLSEEKLIENIIDEAKANNITYTTDEIYMEISFLENINALRRGCKIRKFNDGKYFYITGKKLTHLIAKNKSIRADQKDIPLVTNIHFLTEKFWFMLNKGFSEKHIPKSFMMLNKAKSAISSILFETICNKFNELKKEHENGALTSKEAYILYCEYASRLKKPEEIKPESIDDIFADLSDSSLEHIKNEYETLKNRTLEGEHAAIKIELLKKDEIRMHKNKLKNKYKMVYKSVLTLLYSFYILFLFYIIYLVFYYSNNNIVNTITTLIGIAMSIVGPLIFNTICKICGKHNFILRYITYKYAYTMHDLRKKIYSKYKM